MKRVIRSCVGAIVAALLPVITCGAIVLVNNLHTLGYNGPSMEPSLFDNIVLIIGMVASPVVGVIAFVSLYKEPLYKKPLFRVRIPRKRKYQINGG